MWWVMTVVLILISLNASFNVSCPVICMTEVMGEGGGVSTHSEGMYDNILGLQLSFQDTEESQQLSSA